MLIVLCCTSASAVGRVCVCIRACVLIEDKQNGEGGGGNGDINTPESKQCNGMGGAMG